MTTETETPEVTAPEPDALTAHGADELTRTETMIHPSIAHLLQYFTFAHLPEHLQAVSKPFSDLAHELALCIEGPEATVALRKLLEAKDCAVRAALPSGPPSEVA